MPVDTEKREMQRLAGLAVAELEGFRELRKEIIDVLKEVIGERVDISKPRDLEIKYRARYKDKANDKFKLLAKSIFEPMHSLLEYLNKALRKYEQSSIKTEASKATEKEFKAFMKKFERYAAYWKGCEKDGRCPLYFKSDYNDIGIVSYITQLDKEGSGFYKKAMKKLKRGHILGKEHRFS